MRLKSTPSIVAALILTTFIFSSTSFAKEVSLFAEPKKDAKTLEKIDLSSGVIPIYSPKDSEWVKVADPKNGNVGWIKSSDLNSPGTTAFSFTQKSLPNGQEQRYEFSSGGSKKMDNETLNTYVSKMQAQQKSIQESAQRAMQNMMKELNQFYKEQNAIMKETGFPIFMPIIVLPTMDTTGSSNQNMMQQRGNMQRQNMMQPQGGMQQPMMQPQGGMQQPMMQPQGN